MSISEFHKLEQKFLRRFGFELDEPVHATLNVRGTSLRAIVIPRIDEWGRFVLSYYESEDDYSQPSHQPGVREMSMLSRSVLDYAKADDDEVSVELCRLDPWGSLRKECSEFNARIGHSDRSHTGRLYLHNGQIVVEGKKNSPLARADFSLLNLPMIYHPPDRRVELAAMGWKVVLTLDPEMTRGQHSYTGVVEKCDESSFEIEELDELLDLLTWFFSYVAGGECFPTSIVGYDSHFREVFVRLVSLILRKPYSPNWFDNNSSMTRGGILEHLFPRFCSVWEEYSDEAIEVIRAYLETREVERHIGSRLAVRVSYTGLEALAKLTGSKRIDKALEHYGVPYIQLDKCDHPRLYSLSTELNSEEKKGRGPDLLHKVRNSTAHVFEQGTRRKDAGSIFVDRDDYNYPVLVDLSQFYLEYLFLGWLDWKNKDFFYTEMRRSLIEFYNPERGAAP